MPTRRKPIVEKPPVTARDALRLEPSPGFEGQIEFDLVIELMGRRVKRKAKFDYTHTPEWEYFDLEKGALHTGWESSGFGFSVLGVPDKRKGGRGRKGMWINVGDLLQDDVLPLALFDHVHALIDKACRAQDKERRRLAARNR